MWIGLLPLLVRQVTFGSMKFLVFDYFPPAFYAAFPAVERAAMDPSDFTGFAGALAPAVPLVVSFLSGAVAGVLATFISQPGDAILTRMAQDTKNTGALESARQLWRGEPMNGAGCEGLRGSSPAPSSTGGGLAPFFAGLGPRSLWAGAVISGQFLLYDAFRSFAHVSPKDLTEVLDVLSTALG